MTTITKDKIKDLYYANLLYDLHVAEEKLDLFKTKYKKTFDEYEKMLKENKKENFEEWDDYIEWQAYIKNYDELLNSIEEVKNGNYKIS